LEKWKEIEGLHLPSRKIRGEKFGLYKFGRGAGIEVRTGSDG
jgi:hypothetical protein